jgi:hypothetical protein
VIKNHQSNVFAAHKNRHSINGAFPPQAGAPATRDMAIISEII